jgi:hypothetical protein
VPKFLTFADHIDNGLIPVGLEILDQDLAEFVFSQPGGQKGKQDSVITFALRSGTRSMAWGQPPSLIDILLAFLAMGW